MPRNINKAVALRVSKLLDEKGMTKYRLEKLQGCRIQHLHAFLMKLIMV